MLRIIVTLITFYLSALLFHLHAQPDLVFDTWKTGFTRPVDIANAGDGTDRLFIVEQAGVIKIIENDMVLTTPFMDISDRVNDNANEQGLLGLAFHPDYSNNGYFYVNYTKSNGWTVISRFEVDPNDDNLGDENSESILLEFEQSAGNHNAGDLAFSPIDGYLYISSGDGGGSGDPGDNGQDNDCLLGKMLRIDVDGGGNPASPSQTSGDCEFTSSVNYTIPADNPFVGNSNVLDEIWSTGLRNPWRFSFDCDNGDMWIADVGQNNWEEVNYEKAGNGGENYGWRCYEGNHAHNTSGCSPQSSYTGPVFEYNHADGRSITGGFVYRGSLYPNMVGYYIMADYVTENVWALLRDENGAITSTMYTNLPISSISTFGEDEAKELYAASLNGIIYKVEDNILLPVELNTFTGFHKDGTNYLSWTVASEIDVDHYEIEKSRDAASFHKAGTITANGNSDGKYQFEDRLSSLETFYYRLKVVDTDGQFTYSELIEISTDIPFSVSIYPNPSDGKFHLVSNGEMKHHALLKVYNAAGELMLRETFENAKSIERSYDLSQHPKGIYLVQLSSGDLQETQKIIIR